MERIWKEAAGEKFKVLSWHSFEGTEENHKNLSQDSWSPGQDLNPGSPAYKAGGLNT
jgi:hypothetical protein